MALTQETVVETAVGLLRRFGLGDLSMRRLARELDVQVGALYWHVKNKQELLVEVAAAVLAAPALTAPSEPTGDGVDARGRILHLASTLHQTLLPVPDSSEVVNVARVLAPGRLEALTRLTELLAAAGLDRSDAGSAQALIVNHVLGSVAAAQNRADFDVPGSEAPDFRWALERALDGLLRG
ncbi:hypothetical protein GCM10022377_23910 [Zhihengliuella alba]|uniref:HTH tetR-type domain-containing protein n=1 Tax=Zhihengliuella alba TaxID=547018 RepID=A0ABP7DSS1_9MICC